MATKILLVFLLQLSFNLVSLSPLVPLSQVSIQSQVSLNASIQQGTNLTLSNQTIVYRFKLLRTYTRLRCLPQKFTDSFLFS